MTPSKLAEYCFTRRHNDPMLRRIAQPGERSAMSVVVVLLVLGAFALAAVVKFALGAVQ